MPMPVTGAVIDGVYGKFAPVHHGSTNDFLQQRLALVLVSVVPYALLSVTSV